MTVMSYKQLAVFAKKNICLMLACLLAVCTGCGQEQTDARPEDVELLEPVSAAASYETAARRTLYDSAVHFAIVCPYVEEYELEEDIRFQAYDVGPGEEVQAGGTLLHGNMESYDKQIEDLEKNIAEMDKSYQEFLEDNTEKMRQPRRDQELYGGAVENWNQEKPQEFVTGTDPVTGEETLIANPAYEAWKAEFNIYDARFRKANQEIYELEQALKERTELYELDRSYVQLQIKRLEEDKRNRMLISDMSGYVAGLRLFSEGTWIESNRPVMAVCDPSRVEIRCEYLSRTDIKRAEDVYALVNGKRYEVEYEEIPQEEFEKLKSMNGEVFSTFHVLTDADELEMGDYAVIVEKFRTRENVVTVPRDSVQSDEGIQYVYLVEGDRLVYTVVTTGVTDGFFVEILSGVEEGDKVLTTQAITAGDTTVTVQKGKVSSSFTGTGFLYYPTTETIYNPIEYGTCYLVENLVHQYQRVVKGETIAKVRVVPDQIEINRNEQRLLRERARLEDLKRAGEKDNEKLIAQKEETIRDLEELVSDMKSDAVVTEIKASRNGIIIEFPEGWEEGTLLQRDTWLYVLADENKSYLMLEDGDRLLPYGNKVEISYNDKFGNPYTATGEVATLDKMSLSRSMIQYQLPLVTIPPEDLGQMAGVDVTSEGWWNRRSFRVTATYRCMENVLLVPKSAVTQYAGRTYVKVRLESGEIQYRGFIAGGSDMSNYWVVEGLTEGMEICLN